MWMPDVETGMTHHGSKDARYSSTKVLNQQDLRKTLVRRIANIHTQQVPAINGFFIQVQTLKDGATSINLTQLALFLPLI